VARPILIEIIGDDASLSRALGRSTKNTTQFGASAEKSGKKVSSFGSSMVKLGATIGGIFAVEKVISFGKTAVEEAAKTQKAGEAVTQEYGKQADAVTKFADSAAHAYGVTRQASLDFSAQLGIQGRNMGLTRKEAAQEAIGYQKLAGAFGQIRDQDPASFYTALSKAQLGNTRGLKALGIALTPVREKQVALTLGIKDASSAWTAAQKAQIIYAIAMNHLPQLMDQASHHSNDLANRQRELSAEWQNMQEEIGAKLLPVLTKLANWIFKNTGTVEVFAGVVVGLGVAFGVASAAASVMNSSLVGLFARETAATASTEGLTVASGELAGTAGLGGVVPVVGALIGLGVGAWFLDGLGGLTQFQKAVKTSGGDIQALKGDFTTLHGAMQTSVTDLHQLKAAEKASDPKAVTKAWNAYEHQQFQVGSATAALANKTRNLAHQSDAVTRSARRQLDASNQLRGANGRLDGIVQQYINTQIKLGDQAGRYATWLQTHGTPREVAQAKAVQRHADAAATLAGNIRNIPTTHNVDIYVKTHVEVVNEVVTVTAGRFKGKQLTTGQHGGIVTRPTFALIGEAGPEAVVPLDRTPGSRPLAATAGSSNQPILVTLEVDGRKLAQALFNSNTDYQRHNGRARF
jgi:hypothetical protein